MQDFCSNAAWERIPSAVAVQCFRSTAYQMLPRFAEHATRCIVEALLKVEGNGLLTAVEFEQSLATEWVNDRVALLSSEKAGREVLIIQKAVELGGLLLAELEGQLQSKGYQQIETLCQFNEAAHRSSNQYRLTFSLRFRVAD